ncbi:hypothetical protein FOXB_13831 [Fusarium oxysporum f. sp. conglutinans Fo5176]|uniref:Uncharacterized protein n=1 Tax=Fusarium oxysporum (strain Fo5176) TaxID=660025 RepID=F9G599_FUSOF|nr:hypothetical protein FOXB_13831 [Fusarium oxysporum f. sp. conglutinans Fo5176]
MVQSRLKPAQRVFRLQLLEFAAGPRFSMADHRIMENYPRLFLGDP